MEKKKENKNLEVFSNAPVPQAVLKNVLPAMAAMIMVLIYNLADTFFIGQIHDDILIAAGIPPLYGGRNDFRCGWCLGDFLGFGRGAGKTMQHQVIERIDKGETYESERKKRQ